MNRGAVLPVDMSLNARQRKPMQRVGTWCLGVLVVNLLWPVFAHAAPPAKEIVNKAIKAVLGTSYSAQLKFISQVDDNAVREVKMYHLAPDLYRCEPLQPFVPGEYMVENGSELVRVGAGQVMQLPRRQFAINDSLTIKFLRDLGAMKPPTTVLSGRVGKYETWMLRQDMAINKPYMITVGIDKKTWFPLFLMVIDGQGRARVYYEVEEISYRKSTSLADSLFQVPDQKAPMMRLPFAPEAATGMLQIGADQPLPLFPGWLPPSYRVESLSLLRCNRGVPGKDCALVYQLEAYGPQLDDLVSIFQMQAGGNASNAIKKLKLARDSGYVVSEKNGWVIAVFGDLPQDKLKKIAEQLTRKPERVKPLLQQTVQRDGLMDELRKQQ